MSGGSKSIGPQQFVTWPSAYFRVQKHGIRRLRTYQQPGQGHQRRSISQGGWMVFWDEHIALDIAQKYIEIASVNLCEESMHFRCKLQLSMIGGAAPRVRGIRRVLSPCVKIQSSQARDTKCFHSYRSLSKGRIWRRCRLSLSLSVCKTW